MGTKFKVGEKAAILLENGGWFCTPLSMDFELFASVYPDSVNALETDFSAVTGLAYLNNYILVKPSDALELRKLPECERFEAAKKLNLLTT